ncbi:helicase associated domain-containing protein [Pelagophyceae sp. CCMP2097]|nr:helicase associated domain-containing protein [Pelagophyceae sp. CCMP2097]
MLRVWRLRAVPSSLPRQYGTGGPSTALLDAVRTAPAWEAQFVELEAFYKREGNCVVPTKYISGGADLGRWVDKQRRAFRAGEMLPDRAQRLRDLGFTWQLRANFWDANFQIFSDYIAEAGNVPVRNDLLAIDGTRLRRWVDAQRAAYKNQTARHYQLSKERVKKLEDVGFVWSTVFRVKKLEEDGWGAGITALRAYRAEHGNDDVPVFFVSADGTRLGRWVDTQRRAHATGGMRTDRIQELEELGFRWQL